MTKERRTPKDRYDHGRSLRSQTPIESHAEWSPAPARQPVDLVEGQNEDRLPWLAPVRRARMVVSPFTFYRGGARIMAADPSWSSPSAVPIRTSETMQRSQPRLKMAGSKRPNSSRRTGDVSRGVW